MTQPFIQVQGGTKTYTTYSGKVGDAVSIWSGPGVLNTVQVFNWVESGVGINFFDVNPENVVSGLAGFVGTSSYPVVGCIPSLFNTSSFSSGTFLPPTPTEWQRAIPVGTFFGSGLAFSSRSGGHAFTATYTPGKPRD